MIVMLVMLNLGVGIWWVARPPERADVAAVTARPHAPTLRLLNEAPPPVASPAPAAASTLAEPPSGAALAKAVPRTVITSLASPDSTVAMALPA